MLRPPIVYLDQNHWITIAQAIHSPSKVRSTVELEAALGIARLSTSGAIDLAVSAGHAVETARAGDGARRLQLASTIASLADRCFMTSPISIRRAELRRKFQGQDPMLPVALVFQADPRFVFAGRLAQLALAVSLADRDQEVQIFRSALMRTVSSDEEEQAAISAAQTWVEGLQSLTDWLAENPSGRDLRLVAAARVLADLGTETAEEAAAACVGLERFDEVFGIENIVESMESMPLVGRTLGIVDHRIRNAQKKWEKNDLNDVFFLSAAAAYGDVVVGERFCIDLLRRSASRATHGARLCSKLSEAFRLISGDIEATTPRSH